MFREYLLKKFTRCYNFSDYDLILTQYQDFLDLEALPLNIEDYQTANSSSRYHIESFWIDMYKVEEEKNPFKQLASFFINLMLIPQSNCYIERQFSQVSLIKSERRNLLDVATVSSILKVRAFYEDQIENQSFGPQEKDYYYYNLNINSRNS